MIFAWKRGIRPRAVGAPRVPRAVADASTSPVRNPQHLMSSLPERPALVRRKNAPQRTFVSRTPDDRGHIPGNYPRSPRGMRVALPLTIDERGDSLFIP